MAVITVVGNAATRIVGWGTALFSNKLLLYGVAALAALFGARLWLNHHDDRIFADGKARFEVELRKEYDAKFAQRLEVVAAERAAILDSKASAERRLDQITKLFDQAFARLSDIRAAVEERKIIYVEKAAAVPATQLDESIRSVSDDVAKQTP